MCFELSDGLVSAVDNHTELVLVADHSVTQTTGSRPDRLRERSHAVIQGAGRGYAQLGGGPSPDPFPNREPC